MNSVFDAKTLLVFDRNEGENDRRGKKVENKNTKYKKVQAQCMEKGDLNEEKSHCATEHMKALWKITSETVDICNGAHYCSNTIE